MALRNCALLFFALVMFCGAKGLADCRVRTGDHIVLYGTSDDPKVFVWDSRFRLREYEGGTFDQARALLPHALLADPWTRAIVSACVNNFVQYRASSTGDDAIGILIISGPLHGQRGWVLGTDVRNVQDTSASHHRRHF